MSAPTLHQNDIVAMVVGDCICKDKATILKNKTVFLLFLFSAIIFVTLSRKEQPKPPNFKKPVGKK